jgi:hypothetical protein
MSLEFDGRLPIAPPSGPLRPDFPVWGLFGRAMLYVIGQVMIIPAPWTVTGFYRFLCEHVSLPDGRRLRFAGQPVDIWYILIGLAVLGWLHNVQHAGVSGAVTLATILLTVPVLRWFCANVRTEDGQLRLSFDGETLAYLGWNILLIVSLLTIIGWAWVLKATMQWMCRNTSGTIRITFSATGVSILGHALLLVVMCVFVIPIPWAIRWYANWFASQFSVVAPNAAG